MAIAGDFCYITHNIAIDTAIAFTQGEQVIVENILPNATRPQYKYVVYSNATGQRFQLSDQDLLPLASTALGQPSHPATHDVRLQRQPVRYTRFRWFRWWYAALAVAVIAGLTVGLLFAFTGSPDVSGVYPFSGMTMSLNKDKGSTTRIADYTAEGHYEVKGNIVILTTDDIKSFFEDDPDLPGGGVQKFGVNGRQLVDEDGNAWERK